MQDDNDYGEREADNMLALKGVEMNNTSTSINKSIINQSFNGKTPLEQSQYGVFSNNKSAYSKNSEGGKSMVGTADSKKKRVQQQERYGATSGNKSAGGTKKKSNNDIDGIIKSEVNSPS